MALRSSKTLLHCNPQTCTSAFQLNAARAAAVRRTLYLENLPCCCGEAIAKGEYRPNPPICAPAHLNFNFILLHFIKLTRLRLSKRHKAQER